MIDPSDDARPLRIGPVIVVALGLLLAIAGVLAPSEGTSGGGLRTPVWVPIPDLLTIATLAALTGASAIFIVVVRPWQRRRRQIQDDFHRYQEPGRRSRLIAALGFLLALTPLFLFIAAVFANGPPSTCIADHDRADRYPDGSRRGRQLGHDDLAGTDHLPSAASKRAGAPA